MNKRLKYSGTDKMSDLICENYNLLLVMSRFGLSLGFGDQTVQQVCERQGVHTGTFLAVVMLWVSSITSFSTPVVLLREK
jgi:regulator of cell morphogenesis and NO signaling